jgi:hypothetical protein
VIARSTNHQSRATLKAILIGASEWISSEKRASRK